jgi:hypothetical protein
MNGHVLTCEQGRYCPLELRNWRCTCSKSSLISAAQHASLSSSHEFSSTEKEIQIFIVYRNVTFLSCAIIEKSNVQKTSHFCSS